MGNGGHRRLLEVRGKGLRVRTEMENGLNYFSLLSNSAGRYEDYAAFSSRSRKSWITQRADLPAKNSLLRSPFLHLVKPHILFDGHAQHISTVVRSDDADDDHNNLCVDMGALV